ncbi:NAD(P)/FAD-dependent oxidoreductase [Actinacidiphila acidipaludis]|uniref:FAD-dependent oxidoreductase n=1 Tax=Actinacidiphila acidipaludis TaxID=2873382 RepID=A0ABS7Q6G8_9ACTN|nr:FAD-dependent oxidoreductase [Streptomyces acidipaludis]MBY8878736.1 FAD-dependent oxidoreductase [Streptomyces acidipaludis]
MAPQKPFVIVGGGLAGGKAAQHLREEGYDGPLVLLGDETEHPYERPALSKGYLLGKESRDSVFVHPEQWYADHDVDLRLGTSATAIDLAAHEVTLAGGGRVEFAKLLLATGSTPRRLPVQGGDLEGVLTLRRLADSDRIKQTYASVGRVVVIGAGWIGLETAAAARAAGVEVTVLEMAELPLVRVLGPEAARHFADLHTAHGVDLRCGVRVSEVTGSGGRVDGVRLDDGTHIPAEAVIAGLGVTPNTGLAVAAGLQVDDGVHVDAHLRSSHPDVYAAGDVASAMHPLLGRRIRVEHWANALNQPLTAARAMLGQDAAYERLPYFFTDQYDLGMEYTGYVPAGGYDQVVFRGEPDGGEYIAFWLSDGRVLAGMNVNVWDVTDPIRAIITAGKPVDTDRLADTDVPLTDLAGASTSD